MSTHARDELGIDVEGIASPITAAVSSILSFSAGGIGPVIAASVIRGTIERIIVCITLTAVGFAAAGVAAARLSGGSIWKSVLRLLVGGLSTLAVTYGVGRAVGSSASV